MTWKDAGDWEAGLRRVGLLILFFAFLILLHAMAMSENNDNTADNNAVYGFSPDRSRWINYATDFFDDTKYFYDTKSIVWRNRFAKVWIKYGEPVNDKKIPRTYKEATALMEIDCGARLIKTIEWNYLSMKDEYKKYTSPTKWENVEPETANDVLLEVVCAQNGKVKKW